MMRARRQASSSVSYAAFVLPSRPLHDQHSVDGVRLDLGAKCQCPQFPHSYDTRSVPYLRCAAFASMDASASDKYAMTGFRVDLLVQVALLNPMTSTYFLGGALSRPPPDL